MKVINLPVTSTAITVSGSFNFLNAGELVFQLEKTIEHINATAKNEELEISIHLQHIDSTCKRLLYKYLYQLENIYQKHIGKNFLVQWKYDWFDDDVKNLGFFLDEVFALRMKHKEVNDSLKLNTSHSQTHN